MIIELSREVFSVLMYVIVVAFVVSNAWLSIIGAMSYLRKGKDEA